MNRRQLLSHLKEHKCLLFREGRRHSVFHNAETSRTSTVPRHNEIDDFLARKICKDLGIPIL
ncbi:MAG: type II toxin-antitoxin system HicA family toxin [Candidatus Sungbacteria bacterium]|nr:type II toxin-antitoxin system HicA family toxin [Candidatus Sungbacteria bacterium]